MGGARERNGGGGGGGGGDETQDETDGEKDRHGSGAAVSCSPSQARVCLLCRSTHDMIALNSSR